MLPGFDHQPMRCWSSIFEGFEMKDKTVEDVEHKNEDKMKTFSGALDPRHRQKLGFCGIMI